VQTLVAAPAPNQSLTRGGVAPVGNAPVTGNNSSATINIPFLGPISVPLPATPTHTQLEATPASRQTPIMDASQVPVLGPLVTLVSSQDAFGFNAPARGPVAPVQQHGSVSGGSAWSVPFTSHGGNSTQQFNAKSEAILNNPPPKGTTWTSIVF
jgi:hypothetical protein